MYDDQWYVLKSCQRRSQSTEDTLEMSYYSTVINSSADVLCVLPSLLGTQSQAMRLTRVLHTRPAENMCYFNNFSMFISVFGFQ